MPLSKTNINKYKNKLKEWVNYTENHLHFKKYNLIDFQYKLSPMENTEVKITLSSTEIVGKQLGKVIVMQM